MGGSFRKPSEGIQGALDQGNETKNLESVLSEAQTLGLRVMEVMAGGATHTEDEQQVLHEQVRRMEEYLLASESQYHDFEQKQSIVDLINTFKRFRSH